MKVQLVGGPEDGKSCEFNTSLRYYEFPIELPVAEPSEYMRWGPTLNIGRYELDGDVLKWVGQRPVWDGISDDFDDTEKYRFR